MAKTGKKKESKQFALFLLTLSSLATTVIGLAANIILAANFGTGAEMDAYVVALVVPKTLVAITVSSLAMMVIPGFINLFEARGETAAWQLACRIILVMLIVFPLISLALVLFPDQFAALMAPGFDLDKQAYTSLYIAIMAPIVTVSALETLMQSFFQATGRFAVTVYATGIGGVSYLALLIWLIGDLGMTGVAIATTMQYVIILVAQLVIGFWGRVHLISLRADEDIRRRFSVLMKSAGVLTFTTSVRRLNPALEKYFATQAGAGSASYINYGARFVMIIKDFYVRNVSKVLYPSIATHFAQGNPQAAMNEVMLGARLNMFIIFPMIAGIEVLRETAIRLLLQRGAFTAEDTENVSLALFYGSLFLLQPMVQSLSSKALYSLNAVKFISFDAYLKLFMYLALIYLLMPRLGFVGIILAGSFTITWPLHFIYLHRRIGGFDIRSFILACLRISALAVCMWFGCELWLNFISAEPGALTDIVALITTPLLGVLLYAGAAWLLRFPEIVLAFDKLYLDKKKRARKKAKKQQAKLNDR